MDLVKIVKILKKWNYLCFKHGEQIWVDLGEDYTLRFTFTLEESLFISYEITNNRDNHNLYVGLSPEREIITPFNLDIAEELENIILEVGFLLYNDLNCLINNAWA
jgi:hypothetical protein